MHYCISDIHGDYEKYIEMLQTIDFCDKDVLYVVGDVVDRGNGGMKILLDMMMRANVYPILGNHEYMAIKCLGMLTQEITQESIAQLDEEMMQGFVEWLNIGGQSTLDEFKSLDKEQQEMILECYKKHSKYENIFKILLKMFFFIVQQTYAIFTTNGCNTHPLSHLIGTTLKK